MEEEKKEKEKKFQCKIVGSTFNCKRLFKTDEERIFHQYHDCAYDIKEKFKCSQLKITGHCFCIEELKRKVKNPIIFFCPDCDMSFDSLFLANYHSRHDCIFTDYERDYCYKFIDTQSCDCLKVAEEKLDKWKEDYPSPFDKELANQPVDKNE